MLQAALMEFSGQTLGFINQLRLHTDKIWLRKPHLYCVQSYRISYIDDTLPACISDDLFPKNLPLWRSDQIRHQDKNIYRKSNWYAYDFISAPPYGNVTLKPRRLLNTHSLNIFIFRDEEIIPEYAILSHRWVAGAEVGLDEYNETRGLLYPGSAEASLLRPNKFKSGLTKIRRACKQVRQDGLGWIWIDTCCINKGDHDDVVRNINGMYGYYQNAKICYALLADVGVVLSNDGESESLKGRAEDSDWFGRGWTLQELLAPKEVVFFNNDWNVIGTRN
ncbi:hypothetical protein D9758_011366 [Tetrapyrgos nigripes]|uniref:Heterokaryon incompatibility domain-containing protein n=1 Tax=Tetrapyrgos nigripes TaxID=182062 RepID=A0A8H5G867_9AGAR|nr:hypothetical protein D9758_011366 [Tetrapyrgos nigripes]